MSLEIFISRRAELDLTRQYCWYLENSTLDVAERYLTSADATINAIAALPTLGRKRRFKSEELAGVRSKTIQAPYSAHLIFYRATETELSIERILHGARDLGKRLTEEPEE